MVYKIAVVDDNPKVLDQLTAELQAFGGVKIIFTARNGSDYLLKMKNLPSAKRPRVVIMDIEMPVSDGITAVKDGNLLFPEVEYIMFTVVGDDDKLFEAIKAGARGYLLKDESADAVFDAIKEVVDKSGAPMSASIARKTLKLLAGTPEKQADAEIPGEAVLSDREIEILKGMVSGLNYKQIAEKTFLSPFTVRNHITKIYSKLHICSKAQAVKLAINNKWV